MQNSSISRRKQEAQKVLEEIVVQGPEPQIEDSQSTLQLPEAQAEVPESEFTPLRSKQSRREPRRHLH
jgi:hypothetical protein